jgi:hypothetical protein
MPNQDASPLPSADDVRRRRVIRANRQARWALLAALIAIGLFSLALVSFVGAALQQLAAAPPVELQAPQLLPPAPTILPVPTRTPLPPTPDAGRLTAEARATQALSNTKPLRGPLSGRLMQNTRGMVTIFDTDLDLTDFVLEATFLNPDNEAIGAWDYGFIFRSDPKRNDHQYRFIVNADGKWALEWVEPYNATDNPIFTTIEYGWIPEADFKASTDAANHLRLIVAADQVYAYVNGAFIVGAPVDRWPHGGIKVATSLWKGDSLDGHYTRFRDFTVWRLP